MSADLYFSGVEMPPLGPEHAWVSGTLMGVALKGFLNDPMYRLAGPYDDAVGQHQPVFDIINRETGATFRVTVQELGVTRTPVAGAMTEEGLKQLQAHLQEGESSGRS